MYTFLYICELNMQGNEYDIGTPEIYRFPQVDGVVNGTPGIWGVTYKLPNEEGNDP